MCIRDRYTCRNSTARLPALVTDSRSAWSLRDLVQRGDAETQRKTRRRHFGDARARLRRRGGESQNLRARRKRRRQGERRSLAGDAAVAVADKGGQVQGFRRGDLAFDARERLFQLQAGTVEVAVGLLEDADLGLLVPGAFEPDEVQSAGLDGEPGVGEKRRRIQIYACIAAHHGEAADLGILMHQNAAGEERLVFDLDIAAEQDATGDHGLVADFAVVSDVAAGHDEVAVADFGDGFGRRAARDGEVLADLVALADTEIAAGAGKVLVERVGAEHGAGADLVALAEGGPALDIDVGIEDTVGSHDHFGLDDAKLADSHTRADDGIGRDDGGGGDHRRWIDGHEFV